MWPTFLVLSTCILLIIYTYVRKCHQYYEKRGIPTVTPTFFFGNIFSALLGKESLSTSLANNYRQFPDCKYIGFYKFLRPCVLIRDPALLKEMLIKDFPHFSANDVIIDGKVDYIMSKSLFVQSGHEWKTMRGLLSPMFSNGKIKTIFPLSHEVSQRMTRYIHKQISANNGKCVNGKILCTKFTIDNVAICAFGLDGGAFEGETPFYMTVKDFNDMSLLNCIKMFLLFIFPKLSNVLKIRFFKEEVVEYLTDVVNQTQKYRKDNNITRNDFLDQITALKRKSINLPFTDRDIVAHCAGFFIDGVETSAGVASWVLTEIARHPEVQKKIREELKSVKGANNGEMTYEAINSLIYLEAVINETLRMDHPFGGLLKRCTKTYTLPEVSEVNKSRLRLNLGDSVLISFDGFNFNQKYFPDPNVFKPERFLEENKDGFNKNAFMPFGSGPRFCLGMNFAFLQIKLIVIAVICDFQLSINERMLPIQAHPRAMFKAPLKGFWFDIEPI